MLNFKTLFADENLLNDYIKQRKVAPELLKEIKTKAQLAKQLKFNIENFNKLRKDAESTVDKLAFQAVKQQYATVSAELDKLYSCLPNTIADDVPECQQIVSESTKYFSRYSSAICGTNISLLRKQLKLGVNCCAAGFPCLTGNLALLYRALGQYMMDKHCNTFGYTPVCPPLINSEDSLIGTGQLPKFATKLFRIADSTNYLIPTAETSLCSMHKGEILPVLPVNYVALTPCFRNETVHYGMHSGGLKRVLQFDKVELFKFVHPNAAATALQQVVSHAASILDDLKLSYRTVLLSRNDTSFASLKTYDLEVFLPSENGYLEVSSCSWCGDFQTTKLKIRHKEDNGNIIYPHTINGSALALGRVLIAIMQHYTAVDKLYIPEVLKKYCYGKEVFNW